MGAILLLILTPVSAANNTNADNHLLPAQQVTCTFNVAAGDVAGFITALESALGNLGADTICLGGGTYTFTTHYTPNDGATYRIATPLITDELTIEGNNSTIAKSSLADDYRYFEIGVFGILTLRDLNFVDGDYAVYNSGGDLTIETSSFVNTFGPSVRNYGTVMLDQVSISGSRGGGYAVENHGSATILDSEFIDNSGGGIANNGRMDVDGTTFRNNNSTAGGAIKALSNRITITNSLFDSNYAVYEGGAIQHSSGNATNISASIFLNNRVTNEQFGRGAAVFAGAGGSLDIEQSCIVGNVEPVNGTVVHGSSSNTEATNNWWGTPDGPTTPTGGSGDSTSAPSTPFLTIPPANCPVLYPLAPYHRALTTALDTPVSVTLAAFGGRPPFVFSNIKQLG